jgi:hypothetical protein
VTVSDLVRGSEAWYAQRIRQERWLARMTLLAQVDDLYAHFGWARPKTPRETR